MRSTSTTDRIGSSFRRRSRGLTVAAITVSALAIAGPANATWGRPTTTHGTGLGTVPSGAVSNTVLPGTYGADGDVLASVVSGGVLYIGGAFTHVDGQPAAHLAALNPTTGALITSWTGSADAAVNALALSPDGATLYVGGAFMSLNGGTTARHFGALATSNGSVRSWTRATGSPFTAGTSDGDVYSLVATQTRVYLGGDFTLVNATPANHVVALDATTGDIVAGWDAGVDNVGYTPTLGQDGRITSLALTADSSRLFIGGYFNNVTHSGVTTKRPSLAALNASTGALIPTFQPAGLASGSATLGNTPLAMISTPTHLYVAIGGEQNWLLDYNPVTGGNTRFFTRADGDFQALALIGGKLYAGGHFHQYVIDNSGKHIYGAKLNGYTIQTQFGMRFDATTGQFDASWLPGLGNYGDPGAGKGVWTLSTDGRNLYVGGALSRASNVTHPHLAIYKG